MTIEHVKMIFIVGSPRSGTTMLERILSSHSAIRGGPEPHLLTPLAHLGVWDKVDKAPYDHILAAQAQKAFVQELPGKESDYWAACRAYCDVLYGRYLATGSEEFCLDKTPAYALILPFMMKVYPDACYVVLTRHPVATFSSYANSFFNGDYQAAQLYNPILERYVPALASFLRQQEIPFIHIRYEDLVSEPESWTEKIFAFVGLPNEAGVVEYGQTVDPARQKGLGDPLGVEKYRRPSTESVNKWAAELAADPEIEGIMRAMIARLDPDDLEVFGYPLETLWKPLETLSEAAGHSRPPSKNFSRYHLQRALIVTLRSRAKKGGFFQRSLQKIRLATDVLLRE